jgi:hypothetical protein
LEGPIGAGDGGFLWGKDGYGQEKEDQRERFKTDGSKGGRLVFEQKKFAFWSVDVALDGRK